MKVNKLIMGLLMAASSVPAMAQMPNSAPPQVGVSTVVEMSTGSEYSYVGFIKSRHTVDIVPRVSGSLVSINAAQGSMVKVGDLLIQIEDTVYQANVLAAKAALDQAMAEYEYAKSNFERIDTLFKKQAIAQSDRDGAVRLLDLAKATIDSAKASLMIAENELSYTKIYSPINGKVGKLSISPNNYLTTSTGSIGSVVQLDPIYVYFSLPSREFLNLQAYGDKLDEHLDFELRLSNDEIYNGDWYINVVNNTIDSETDSIRLWVSFDNPDNKLVPGGYVVINMKEKLAKSVPTVNVSALLTDVQGTYVYVLDENNRAVRRDVTTGHTVGANITVESGLSNGEMVIVEGTNKVMSPNMEVNPVLKEQL